MASVRPTTVRQLLATPVLETATLLGGESGLDHVVTDIHLMSGVSRKQAPPAGGLVVLDGTSLDEHAYLVDHALRVLSETRGAGLILAQPRRRPDQGPARLANQFEMPLLVAEDQPALELAFRLRTSFWSPDVDQAAVVKALLEDLSHNQIRSVDAVVARASGALGVSIALLDRYRRPTAGAALDVAGRRLAEQSAHHADASGEAVLHSVPIVLQSGDPISYWLVAESAGPVASYNVIATVLQICGWYLTAMLASAQMHHEREARRRIAVLNELLESAERPERELQAQLTHMGWTVTGWNMGLHIKLRGLSDSGRVVDLHADMRQRLEDEGVRGPLVERTDGWSGWTTFAEEPTADLYTDTTTAVSDALDGFVSAHSGLTAHAGLGRPSVGIAGLRGSLGEAHEASLIALARLRGRSGAAHIDQLGVQRVLIGWFGSDEFNRFAHAMLEPVLAVDRDGTMLSTLEAYLDGGGSSTAAAAALGVHRNTIANRVGRVAALLRTDLSDAEVRLSLQLACRMVRLER